MTDHTVAVFGATGFIGRSLMKALEARGITTLIPQGPSGHRIDISGDIEALAAAIDGVDVVVNVAGKAHTHSTNPADFWPANAIGARNVARAVASTPSVQRLVHVSSVAVGSGGLDPAVADFLPFTAYGASKAAGEIATAAELTQADADLVIVRPAGIGGPDSPGAWGTIRRLVADGRRVPIPKADVRHEVVEIAEVTDFLVRSATLTIPAGIYPLPGQGPFTIAEYVDMAARDLGVTPRTVRVPIWALDPVLTSSSLVERACSPAIRIGRVVSTLTRQRPLVHQVDRG